MSLDHARDDSCDLFYNFGIELAGLLSGLKYLNNKL
jgi:hypothetical protein